MVSTLLHCHTLHKACTTESENCVYLKFQCRLLNVLRILPMAGHCGLLQTTNSVLCLCFSVCVDPRGNQDGVIVSSWLLFLRSSFLILLTAVIKHSLR